MKSFIEKYKNVYEKDDMLRAAKWVKERLDLDRLFSTTQKLVNNIDHSAVDEYGRNMVYVLDIAPGSYGVYQHEKAAEEFGIEFDEDMEPEWVWNEICQFADIVAAYINEVSPLDGRFFFNHFEADNSFGLFYAET